jgi:hypothetical protein
VCSLTQSLILAPLRQQPQATGEITTSPHLITLGRQHLATGKGIRETLIILLHLYGIGTIASLGILQNAVQLTLKTALAATQQNAERTYSKYYSFHILTFSPTTI